MPDLTEAQRGAAEEVKQITDSWNQISLIAVCEWHGCVAFNLGVDTSGFARRSGELVAQPWEPVTVLIAPDYPSIPPQAVVKYLRWSGFPHVLQGHRLCLYLDPGTEWDPTQGMQGFLLRLWGWLADAIGGRFDPETALYYPVGGVPHRTEGAPTVVATTPLPKDISDKGIVNRIGLRVRTDHRIDIAAWTSPGEPGFTPGLLVVLPEYLPLGGGSRLSDLIGIVRDQIDRKHRRTLQTSLRRLIRNLNDDQYFHVIIAVPNPADTSNTKRHLIGWRLRSQDADKALAATRNTDKALTTARNTASTIIESTTVETENPVVEWTYVDDQRPDIAVRRDHERPVAVYAGRKIAVWGCGALGSWIAELLVRAGAGRVTLRDPGFVTSGLLVRQNYTEEDVGRPKVEALADRLRRLSDTCEIASIAGHAQTGMQEDADDCDYIFDTSVNTSVNATLDNAQKRGTLPVPVVQAATDNQTATLGIVTITDGTSTHTTSNLDQALHEHAVSDPKLTAFHTFWDHDSHPPFTPAPGCSIPTFHGSAADAMGIVASIISVAAIALSRHVVGGYLLALPHSSSSAPVIQHVLPSE